MPNPNRPMPPAWRQERRGTNGCENAAEFTIPSTPLPPPIFREPEIGIKALVLYFS